jgi:hypothetical protein
MMKSLMNRSYWSRGQVSCFEGADDAAAAAEAARIASDAARAAAADAAAKEAAARDAAAKAAAKFTQDDVNRFLADDKRKHQAALTQMEQKLATALEDKTMTEATRKTLEENLAAVRGELRTKEEMLTLEKKRVEETLSQKIGDLEKQKGYWENLYRESSIERSLQDAAVVHGACRPEQIVTLLRGQTKLVQDVDETTGKPRETYQPKVEMSGVDPQTGEGVTLVLTPHEAVKRMSELPDIYGNLFKVNVVSGIGGGMNTGGAPGSGRVDVRKLTPQQYRELREKDPEKLGLRRKGRR